MNAKEKYRAFCEEEYAIKIFSQPFWLDAVCGEANWDVALVERDGMIVAAMPYFMKRRFLFFKYITMPKLTQTLGPYFKYPPDQKYEKKLDFEKKMIDALLDQLPAHDVFMQSFHYEIENWLPLYWRGYEQTTKYTYVIDDLSDMEKILADFSASRRRSLRNRTAGISILNNLGLREFYEFHSAVYRSQGLQVPYSFAFLQRLDDACGKHNCRELLFAVDAEQNILAALYAVWDRTSLYSLLGGTNVKINNNAGGSMLDYELMKIASRRGLKFDFEGSMIERIEAFNRTFGAVQKAYFQITKVNSFAIKLRRFVKGLGA